MTLYTSKKVKLAGLILTAILFVLFLLPFLNNVAYDAVIHFAFAEKFVEGLPFHFNANDSNIIASTSPFWTLLLIVLTKLFGSSFIIPLKIIIVVVWLITTYLIYLITRNIWKFSKLMQYSVLLVWLLNISVLKNSLGGMENILSAMQLLLILYLLYLYKKKLNIPRVILLGILSGWGLLTRPDIGALCLSIVLLFYITLFISNKITGKQLSFYLCISLLFSVITLLPWYLYQYEMTGKIISDSAHSRIFTGRWNSTRLINGILYFHPFLIMALFTAFLPFTAGVIIKLKSTSSSLIKNKNYRVIFSNENYFKLTSWLILLFGIIFYSFVAGGSHTGRYFLPFYPFLFLLGISGLNIVYSKLSFKESFIIIIALFLLGVNLYDYYNRTILGKQMESDVIEIIKAKENRKDITSAFLRDVKYNINDTITLAIVEVQFRYFVDDRIIIQSLDGVTSDKVFKYMGKDDFPDYDRYILDTKPDLVEFDGWKSYLKSPPWHLNFLPRVFKNNILSEWDEKTENMKTGESFLWNSYLVTYVKEKDVKIDWDGKNN